MRLLPIERYELTSPEPPEVIKARITSQLGRTPLWKLGGPERHFEGYCDEKSFRITPAAYWGRGIWPVFKGQIEVRNGLTHIRIMHHPGAFQLSALVGLAIMYALILAVVISEWVGLINSDFTRDTVGLLMGLTIPLIMIAAGVQDMWNDSRKYKDILKQVIGGDGV